MKKLIALLAVVCVFEASFAQPAANLPEFQLQKQELQSQLMYIASDELAGRRTGSEGEAMAADFISKNFEAYGVAKPNGQDSYFQKIPFARILPPAEGMLTLGDERFEQGNAMLITNGGPVEIKTTAVFAKHAWIDEQAGVNDFEGLDVRGKVVFALPGNRESKNPYQAFQESAQKRKWAMEHGAIGLVELYRLRVPWQFFQNYLSKERLEMLAEEYQEADQNFFSAWIREDSAQAVGRIEKGETVQVSIHSTGLVLHEVQSVNVAGIIPGTDEKLKEEYILLSAHFDHIGVGKQGGGAYTEQDSIFNGARDNGMGTVALMAAAKAFAVHPPKRSVILLACTGEEMGMLGSAYYAAHPLVPLAKTVFNLNTDGAGYNDKEYISIIGWGRTNTGGEIEQAASALNLKVAKDPEPQQNLFERSDNISFARKGVPAIDLSPGFTEMDEEIFKYYHQVADNPESIDYDYLLTFCNSFVYSARLIADKAEKPAWTPGDKFEKATHD
ncbi:MAG: M28 family peptidase [Saprospiraceae bacterium]|nr:MAG: M28 family peptidase [Saprospiraceae bacterium]